MSWEQEFESSPDFSGQILTQEPLSKYTWYRIGGPARLFITPKTRQDLHWIAHRIAKTHVPHFILGAGSNLLANDSGFDGVVIRANRFLTEIDSDAPTHVRTGGGAMLSSLLRQAAQEGWGGLEFLAGIPGTVGGAVRMNAGTHLGETASRLRGVKAVDLATGRDLAYSGDELRFSYRSNGFLPLSALVTSADWEVTPSDPGAVKLILDETLARRKATQPIDQPSCGSVFKNPHETGLSAWQVVDKLGLRGHRIGDAQISEKHSNFIVNQGAASASEVRTLIELVQKRSKDELGIKMETEVIFI